jgi:hypothetical protein
MRDMATFFGYAQRERAPQGMASALGSGSGNGL